MSKRKYRVGDRVRYDGWRGWVVTATMVNGGYAIGYIGARMGGWGLNIKAHALAPDTTRMLAGEREKMVTVLKRWQPKEADNGAK